MKNNQSILAYLACPYSHPDATVRNMRYMTANRIAFELHRQGKFVYSPLTHNVPLIQLCNEVSGWGFWGEFDKFMLTKSDKLLVLAMDGWEKSKGVLAEIKLAGELNLPIEMIDPQEGFNKNNAF
jgi:hypothetical protein